MFMWFSPNGSPKTSFRWCIDVAEIERVSAVGFKLWNIFVSVPYFTVIFPFQFCFSFCRFVSFSFSLFYVSVCVSVKPLTFDPKQPSASILDFSVSFPLILHFPLCGCDTDAAVRSWGRCWEGRWGTEQSLVQWSSNPRWAVASDWLPWGLLQAVWDGVCMRSFLVHTVLQSTFERLSVTEAKFDAH